MSTSDMDRRDFVHALAVAGGSVAVGGLVAGCRTDATHDHGAMMGPELGKGNSGGGGGGKGGGQTARYPLVIPEVVSPAGLTLGAAPGIASIVPDKSTPALLYNGTIPGPTIVAQSGQTYDGIRFNNGLDQDSIIHWHGLFADPANDGHPRDVVGPGGSYEYELAINQRAALHWYHPHPHMMTGHQVYHGLAGAFIVRDGVDTGTGGLGLPSGDFEVPLIIRDASFDSRGNFRFSNKSSGFWGDTPLVNGTYAPYLEVKRGVYRFRMLNGCNARVLRLALSSGAFTLIGNDGGLLDQVYTVDELVGAPAERFDVLLDFSTVDVDTTLMLRDLDAGWDVLEFRVVDGDGGTGKMPTGELSNIDSLGSPKKGRIFTFDGMTRINGKVYDMADDGFLVPFGEVEQWTFVTNGNGPHPVHVHGTAFQVIGRTGGRGQLYPWEQGWKDTVLVNDGETVDVLIRFDQVTERFGEHRGQYIMHCHQLAHEDAGMMANFVVT